MPESTGDYSDIIIFSSSEDRILLEPLMDDLFSEYVNTPQIEMKYKIKYDESWNLNNHKKHNLIILANTNYPSDSTGDLLFTKFMDKYDMSDGLILLENLYAQDQLVFIFNGMDAIDYQDKMMIHRGWILEEINQFKYKMLKEAIFKNGKNHELSSKIKNKLDYSLDLQLDYKEIKIDSINSFAWVGRGYPYRWIAMYKDKKEAYSNFENSWKNFELNIEKYMNDVSISKYFKKNEKIKFKNNDVQILRGLYEHGASETGGPFFTYIFDVKGSNDLILIAGFVNNPGKDKLRLLDELEIIIRTINYGGN